MKGAAVLGLATLAAAILAGCGESPASAPEDDQFQKDLAAASAKNADKEAGKRKAVGVSANAPASQSPSPQNAKATPTSGR